MKDYLYDVAISCLARDKATGQQLHDLLAPRVGGVFFYTERQADLVTTDGLESLREPFRHQSRAVVILYREEWGSNRWTRVEEIAIKEMCFDDGWQRIVLYSLDKSWPRWLPETYIWGQEQERWGLEGLAAVVERKVKEAGGTVGEEDPVAVAERLRREIDAIEALSRLRRSPEGVTHVTAALGEIRLRLQEIAGQSASNTMMVRFAKIARYYAIYTDRHAVFCELHGAARNSVHGAELLVEDAAGPPGTYAAENNSRTLRRFVPEPKEDGQCIWVENTRKQRFSSHEVANLMARHLFEEHRRKISPVRN